MIQDKISELYLLEKAKDIQDIFFEWSDDIDLYLKVSLACHSVGGLQSCKTIVPLGLRCFSEFSISLFTCSDK